MSPQTLRESAISGAVWVGIDRWATQILSFLIYVLLARLLGPTSFGLIALAGVYLAFIDLIAKQGFEVAVVQRKNLEDAHLDAAFWLNLLVATFLALASIFSAGQLAILFGEPRLTEPLKWLSGALVLKGLSAIPRTILERGMAFRALAIRSLLATVAGGVVGLGMAWGGLGVWSLVGQQLSSGIIGTMVLWWATPWRPAFNISRGHLRDLYGFSINILGKDLLWLCGERADQFLIGVRLGASSLGPYSLVMRIIDILVELITVPFVTVALPAFSRLQDERQRLRNAFYKTTEVVATVSIPAFFGLSLLAPNYVPVFFGPEWTSSITLIQILAVSGMVRATLCCVPPVMLALGRPGVYLALVAFCTVLAIGLCLFATQWNLLIVAMAMSLGMCIYCVAYLLVLRKLIDFSFRVLWQSVQSPVIASGSMIAAVWTLRYLMLDKIGDSLFIVMSVPIGIIVYITAMTLIKPQIVHELRSLVLERLKKQLGSRGASKGKVGDGFSDHLLKNERS